jgi:hypothetical protein
MTHVNNIECKGLGCDASLLKKANQNLFVGFITFIGEAI